MHRSAVMKELSALGSESARKMHARNGVTGPTFGVRYGDLYKLVKKAGTDHALALELWKSGNHDARVLATMIADPGRVKPSELDTWARAVDNQLLLDAVATLASKTKHARRCVEKWSAAKREWVAAAGWHLLAALAGGGRDARPARDGGGVTDAELAEYLATIETSIHGAPNRVRHSMNSALIAIGGLGGKLQKQALAVARRIGPVAVDHGKTSCKTPDAVAYIKKLAARSRGPARTKAKA